MSSEETSANVADDEDPSWQLWGPYMTNREWGTMRETDGSEGQNWNKFPYHKAAQKAYRYCEDGIFGVCDQDCRICHSYAFWNYKDDHLKERYFGVSNGQGAHGEEAKEMYYYKAADPQYRYISSEYLYPQTEFPYQHLVQLEQTFKQSSADGSGTVSLSDFNWYAEKKYFEIEFEMSKLTPDQLCFQLSITNCGSAPARIVAMPMLFLRNTWQFGQEDVGVQKIIKVRNDQLVVCLKDADDSSCAHIGYYYDTEVGTPEVLLTDNGTRSSADSRGNGSGQHYKDSFHRYVVAGDGSELMPNMGAKATKAGLCYRLAIGPNETVKLRTFLMTQKPRETVALNWRVLSARMEEVKVEALVKAYQSLPTCLVPAEQDILNGACVTLMWNRQFYPLDLMSHLRHFSGKLPTRLVTVPDKWEQPYLATWDTALHCLCLNCFDRRQALKELMLLLALIRRDGSIYNDEYRPDGVAPPLIILAAIDVYGKCTDQDKASLGPRIYFAMKRHLHWWMHRRDACGVQLIDGGICGIDYVSLFPREILETGEGLIWALFFLMRFLELALAIYATPGCIICDQITRDLPILTGYMGKLCATFVQNVAELNGLYHPYWRDVGAAVELGNTCSNSSNKIGRSGSDVSADSFVAGSDISYGVTDKKRCHWLHAYCYLPMICCCSLPNIQLTGGSGVEDSSLESLLARLFNGPTQWESRAPYIFADKRHSRLFISVLSANQLTELLEQVLNETQFLAKYGIRTMSLMHTCEDAKVRLAPRAPPSTPEERLSTSDTEDCESDTEVEPRVGVVFQRQELVQKFCPGPSVSQSYGGNTNWYGSVNLPYNYLLLEALHKWSTVLDNKFDMVEYPSYSGRYHLLKDIMKDLAARNVNLFLPNAKGVIPSTGEDATRGILFYETFDGDTGLGYGAAHKGGWSAIIARILMLMHGLE